MINALRFEVPGEPVSKGRPRSTADGHHYTPAKTVAYERLVAWTAKAAMGSADRIAGPVSVLIVATWGIPASWSKKRSQAAMGGPKTSKPDVDNIAKICCDAMNGVVWNDDAQVHDLRCRKCYGLEPGVVIEVTA